MAKTLNVLIIDDHPLIVKAYNHALKYVGKQDNAYQFNIDWADTCDSAFTKVKNATKEDGIDLIFLDISLPPSEDGEIFSGEELGILIRKELKAVKIIVSTTYNDNTRLNSIFKSVNPEGFLIKNDLTPEILSEAIEVVIADPPYYGKTVLKFLRKMSANDFALDSADRKLLYELSRGTKMKELPDILLLSIAAIERRKRILKEVFNVEGKGDRDLILAAETAGFV